MATAMAASPQHWGRWSASRPRLNGVTPWTPTTRPTSSDLKTNTGASLIMNGNGNGGLTSTLGPVVSVPPAAEWRYAMDSNNQTYQFAFSGVWDLPVGRAKHFGNGVTGVADKLLSNWTIDWAYQWVSGEPLGLPTLWNFCGNWNNPQGTQFNAWFNNTTSCYAQYPTNTSGFTYLPPRWEGRGTDPGGSS